MWNWFAIALAPLQLKGLCFFTLNFFGNEIMNYTDKIDEFWEKNEKSQFTPIEIALYFFLLNEAQRRKWPEKFRINSTQISSSISVKSFKTLSKARQRLHDSGLVNFATRSGSPYVEYSFDKIPTIQKKENPRFKKETPPKPKAKKRKTLTADDVTVKDDPFYKSFEEWLAYKRERKQSYKSERSLMVAFEKLKKLSNNNPDTAMAIVKESMSNNWAGLFPLKDNKNGTNNGKVNRQRSPVETENYETKDYSATFFT